ncbi:MAG: hypothetical protein WAN65_18740 [Candidatus Sulfotelmatobacter sp.]
MAERKRRAPQVRNHLAAIKSKVARKGASSEEIVAILTRDHPNAIRTETADILHIGLIKLANDICSLRSGPATTAQLEMFAEYGTGRMVNLRVPDSKGRVQRIHKMVDALTKPEARNHIAENTKPARPRQSKQIAELVRLVDDMDKYGEADWTLGQCWKAAHG